MAKVSNEDLLIQAMLAREPEVTLEGCIMPLNTIVQNAFKKDRRILAYFSGFQTRGSRKGLFSLGVDYEVTFTYPDNVPADPADVVVDDGTWDASSLLGDKGPIPVTIVTDNVERVQGKLDQILKPLITRYEGLLGWEWTGVAAGELTPDTVLNIRYRYLTPPQDLLQKQNEAAFAAKTIWKTILGRANVPQFVKPFLAMSYLAQECSYDQKAYDEISADFSTAPSDPVPSLAYGPLVARRGICTGFAWAFKRLMDEANIECQCISGYIREGGDVGHMWNLVKMDGQYYHVDPTSGAKGTAVDVSKLMQPDSVIKATHIWQQEEYPVAKGMRLSYDYVEDFLAENGDIFIDDGASEKYMFPASIID